MAKAAQLGVNVSDAIGAVVKDVPASLFDERLDRFASLFVRHRCGWGQH
jgi:hypothetical protein